MIFACLGWSLGTVVAIGYSVALIPVLAPFALLELAAKALYCKEKSKGL